MKKTTDLDQFAKALISKSRIGAIEAYADAVAAQDKVLVDALINAGLFEGLPTECGREYHAFSRALELFYKSAPKSDFTNEHLQRVVLCITATQFHTQNNNFPHDLSAAIREEIIVPMGSAKRVDLLPDVMLSIHDEIYRQFSVSAAPLKISDVGATTRKVTHLAMKELINWDNSNDNVRDLEGVITRLLSAPVIRDVIMEGELQINLAGRITKLDLPGFLQKMIDAGTEWTDVDGSATPMSTQLMNFIVGANAQQCFEVMLRNGVNIDNHIEQLSAAVRANFAPFVEAVCKKPLLELKKLSDSIPYVIFTAAHSGANHQVIAALAKAGFDLNMRSPSSVEGRYGPVSQPTMLVTAILRGNYDTAKALIECGARMDLPAGRTLEQPMHVALKCMAPSGFMAYLKAVKARDSLGELAGTYKRVPAP